MDFGLAGDRIYFKFGYKLFLFIFVFICVVGVKDIFRVLVYYFLLQKGIPALTLFFYNNWSDLISGKFFWKCVSWMRDQGNWVLEETRKYSSASSASQKKETK